MARPKQQPRPALEATLEAFEAFQQRIMAVHAPEFTSVDLTMAQAKLLYVVTAAGELSDVRDRSAPGRHDLDRQRRRRPPRFDRAAQPCRRPGQPAPGPRVGHALGLETLEQLRELSIRQMRALFEVVGDADLEVIQQAIRILDSAVESARTPTRSDTVTRLSQLAVSKRSVTLLLAVALFIAGILAWGNLKQELLPDVSFPIVTVIAPYPGAGAADVTEQVAKPIEQAISGVPGLSSLRSTSANSFAFVLAQFEYGTDLDEATATIEENLRTATLPQTVEPTVGSFNFNAAPVVVASVSALGETDLEEAAEIARTEIIPELQAIPGVASADLAGGLEDRLVITLDPRAMAEAGVSMQQAIGVLQANNITIPGGELPTDEARIPVSTIGRFDSVEEIENLVVGVKAPVAAPLPSGQPAPSIEPGARSRRWPRRRSRSARSAPSRS